MWWLLATALAGGPQDDDDLDCFCEVGPCNPSGSCAEVVPGDCDDTRAGVHPGAVETCATGYDDDCDGDPNTTGGVYTLSATSPLATGPFYLDNDGDGEGGTDSPEFWLCSRTAAPAPYLFTVTRTDCDDADPLVARGMVERCNGIDDDCDVPTLIDEPMRNSVPLGSAEFFLDDDNDGYGARGGPTVWMCPGWYGDPVHLRDCNGTGLATEGHSVEFTGDCWNILDSDCDDDNRSMSPAEPERLDARDTNCDGDLPTVELDCDNDGAMAATPEDPGGDPIDSAALGLADCAGLPPLTELSCLGTSLAVRCDPATGLWLADVAPLVPLGLFANGRRVGIGPTSCAGHDCDDTCPARCEGETETCDGIDGDCNGYVHAADLDGIPDPMSPADVYPGLVDEDEVDLDGDGVIEACRSVSTQTATASSRCEPLLVVPSAPVDTAEDEPDTDDDGCGCATPRGGVAWAPLLVLLPWVRRRR